ncbi:MAG: hypothetical protein ABL964_16255 [Steroidobacteraceae bacterium]
MAKNSEALHYKVRRFRSMAICLKELEPFIRHVDHLRSGKPFVQLDGMRSREVLANWLICAALNFEYGANRMSFTSDPTGGDGVIHDSQTQTTWRTEHVMVRRALFPHEKSNPKPVQTEIIEAVALKQAKGGASYASGKQLVVFLDSGGGEWHPNKVAHALPQPLLFVDAWVVGLHGPALNQYVYGVTKLDLSNGNAPVWIVRLAPTFDGWTVQRIQ